MVSVFDYTDFRKFLSDFYEEKKSSNKNFSHRYIARRIGLKSSGHFSQILSGRANISIGFIDRFAEFLQLNKRETPYFQSMVLFNQAKTHDVKKRYFEKMISFKEGVIHTINVEQYEFYEKWYFTAIRELLSFYPFRDDYESLAGMLVPAITAAEAREAIVLLERLRLIRREPAGGYAVTDALITTGYDAQSNCINDFVGNALKLSKGAIDRFDRKERIFSWVSLSLSSQGYETIIEELRESRRRIMNIAANDPSPNRVYLFNFQFFPLSKPLIDGKGDTE